MKSYTIISRRDFIAETKSIRIIDICRPAMAYSYSDESGSGHLLYTPL